MDMPLAPAVGFPAQARRAGFTSALQRQPVCESQCRRPRLLDGRVELWRCGGGFYRKRVQVAELVAEHIDATQPKVFGVARQVLTRLRQEWWDRAELCCESGRVRKAQRKLIGPELNQGMVARALVIRGVTLFAPDGAVEGRVACPGLQHPQVEIEPIHFGAQYPMVNLLCNRPVGRGQ